MYELRDLGSQLGKRLHFTWLSDVDTDGPVAGFFRDLGRGVDAAANAVADAVETALNVIGDFLADLYEAIGNFLALAIEFIGHGLGQIPIIGPLIQFLFHWVATVVSAVFDLVATFIKGVLNIVGAIIGGVVRIVGGAIGGLLAWDARIAGKSVLNGLIDIGAGVAGAVVLILGKLLGYLQAFFFMQLGERTLTKEEEDLLRQVYRGSVAYWNIRVIEGFAGFYSAFYPDRAFTLGDKIYLKSTPPGRVRDVLVHECCHVWQYQHFGSRYLMEALVAQTANGYDWQAQLNTGTVRWQDLNREGQAQFVQETWLGGQRPAPPPPLRGNGVFFADDPIGADVEFSSQGTSLTSFAVEAISYIRSLVALRITAV